MTLRSFVRSLRRHFCRNSKLAVCLSLAAFGTTGLQAEDVLKSNFESSVPKDNPWSGINSAGLISVTPGEQRAVDNEGHMNPRTVFAPSVAVGDLNGDGLPDLVIGDSKGFIWYFPNSGTPTEPKFTWGEVMPIWLGSPSNDADYGEGGADNVIPRVAIVDANGDGKKPDLLIGNYSGRLFYLPNRGSVSTPDFRVTPSTIYDNLIKTRRDGLLWCNFLAPTAFKWFGGSNPDMLMGDGSYSANSIYLYTNQGIPGRPIFNENAMIKIIPGMGREHLTPQVIDWNNDGKPDVISGERLGFISLFLNTSTDPKQPTFDEGKHITIAGKENFGDMTSVTVCDLTNNKLPNLIVANSKGEVSYALNTGKPGAPVFNTLVPIVGKNPFPQVLRPIGWGDYSPNNPSGLSGIPWGSMNGAGTGVPYGVPYELLVVTNATVEPDFVPPPNTTFKNALRYYVQPTKNVYFPQSYYPSSDQLFNDQHGIRYSSNFALKEGAPYRVSFWVRGNGITDLTYHIDADHTASDGNEATYEHIHMGNSVSIGNAWTKYEESVSFSFQNDKLPKDRGSAAGGMNFWFQFKGQGNLYIDDVTITPEAGQ